MNEVTLTGLPREGELFDEKYRIGSVLGVGGMAAVISAKHLGFDEMVAIKVLLPECSDDPAVVARFVQEGRTATKIHSEHVVRMLDVGVFAGRAYLVMEHLDGRDLDALVRRDGPVALDSAIDMLLQACEAIGEAHALGIVHRDLKPANLFLTHRTDGSPCVKVLDFGISKRPRDTVSTDGHPTLSSAVMGSPQYMAPEQMVSAAAADQRSDIWSLGTILYELLTGRLAFEGSTTSEVCARVLQGAPVPVVHLRHDLPAEIASVIARCLEKDPSLRYANVAELARALAPFGTANARASADSIWRVVEGTSETRASSPSVGSMRPSAKDTLAAPPVRRRRVSGYLAAAFLTLAALGVMAVGVRRHVVSPHVEPPAVAAAAPPPPVAAIPPAAASVAPPPRHHAAPRHAALVTSALPASDDSGPYDDAP